MIVRGVELPGPVSGRRAAASQGGFSVATGAPGQPGVAAASAACVDGLLLLQETDGMPERRRRGRRWAQSVLKDLMALQLGLLGEGEGQALAQLQAALAAAPDGDDPAVAGVTLRIRVELARRGM